MKEPIQLATLTIDLSEISEINDNDDRIIINFHSEHDPPFIELTGANADAIRKWLDTEWQHCLDRLESRGENVQTLKKPWQNTDAEPPQITDEPPF